MEKFNKLKSHNGRKKLVITGSEGLIGKKLTEHFKNTYEVVGLDMKHDHNLTDDAFVEKWFKENKGLYGLIVCHAYNPVPVKGAKKIEPVDVPLEEVRQYMEVNVVSAFNVCRHFIKNNKKGVIVNMSSIYGESAPKHFIYKDFVKHVGYSLSKGSIPLLSKYLATYYGPDIRVNTVVFGGIADSKQDANFVKEYGREVPMKRLMNIEEVTSVFDFLLDENSSYVTGAEITVDGGWGAW